MQRIPNLLVLALVSLALAAVAAWFLRLAFPLALALVLAGVLARDFAVVARTEAAPGTGVAAAARGGIALALRLLIGTAVLALMLVSALWMLQPGA